MRFFGIKRKMRALKKVRERSFWSRARPKIKRFINILLAVGLFAALLGSAFSMSVIFGIGFVVAFTMAVYHNELKKKPWRPLAVFVGALVTRFALEKYLPVFSSETTIFDLS